MGKRREKQAAVKLTPQEYRLSVFVAEDHGRLVDAARLFDEGVVLAKDGQLALARDRFRECIRLEPRPESFFNLTFVCNELKEQHDAIDAYRRALELESPTPKWHDAHFCLAQRLAGVGRIREAVKWYRSALALSDNPAYRSHFLMALAQYHPDYDDRAVLEESCEYDRRYAQPLAAEIRPHANDRSPDRRLRIGYVSPNFSRHVCGLFLSPLLAHHDHERFEIFAYSDVSKPDDWTGPMLANADRSQNIVGMSDGAVADLVRRDGIDVLVDLTMHMVGNRMLVFARKPAPVQVTWLAYPGTCGLGAIDYRISDPFLDPAGSDLRVYAERTIRLPDCFWIYSPLSEVGVSPLPARRRGYVTFGCLCGFAKVNDEIIALWSRVLRAVPCSRFLMLAPEGQVRKRTLATFARNGVEHGRVEFVSEQLRDAYLATYWHLDVFLDSFPVPGHTTALDSAWMGVPVVSLLGRKIVSRAPLSIASNLGLPELVARTAQEYVDIAVGLANDLDRLANLRAGLRARMDRSPLMDAMRFTRNLERAYRTMWLEWCQT